MNYIVELFATRNRVVSRLKASASWLHCPALRTYQSPVCLPPSPSLLLHPHQNNECRNNQNTTMKILKVK